MSSKPLSFNENAKLYDQMRPGYPRKVFTELQEKANLDQHSHILEVGCGSGQATKDLIAITKQITCIDPGNNLLNIAKAKFPESTFVHSTFEEYNTQDIYDLIISATAWHWVDPKVEATRKRTLSLNRRDGLPFYATTI